MTKASALSAAILSLVTILTSTVALATEVQLVSEKVEDINLSKDCKIVRAIEPKADLTYKVMKFAGLQTVIRPIYSDLCNSKTQQFITRLYFYISENEQTPVIGMTGGNEDGNELSFPVFSGFVLKK